MAFRLLLEAVRGMADLDASGRRRSVHRSGPLLHHVGQLVGEHVLAGIRLRRVGAGLENDVAAHGVGLRAHRPGRLRCLGIGVHANVAEVTGEPALHEVPCRGVERLAAPGPDHILHR